MGPFRLRIAEPAADRDQAPELTEGVAVGFDVHVKDMTSAASTLHNTESPSLPAEAPPNVGGTDGASGYAADYRVWFVTRRDDLKAGDRQVDSLVTKIRQAAQSYESADEDAREVYLKALDGRFEKIDR